MIHLDNSFFVIVVSCNPQKQFFVLDFKFEFRSTDQTELKWIYPEKMVYVVSKLRLEQYTNHIFEGSAIQFRNLITMDYGFVPPITSNGFELYLKTEEGCPSLQIAVTLNLNTREYISNFSNLRDFISQIYLNVHQF